MLPNLMLSLDPKKEAVFMKEILLILCTLAEFAAAFFALKKISTPVGRESR